MGKCAENTAQKMKIERKEQDDYAKLSFEYVERDFTIDEAIKYQTIVYQAGTPDAKVRELVQVAS